MSSVILYAGEWCGDCQKMKAFLDSHDIAYEIRDINKNPEYGNELKEKTGKLGVPYLILDGEWVIGYEPGKGFTEEYAKQLFQIKD